MKLKQNEIYLFFGIKDFFLSPDPPALLLFQPPSPPLPLSGTDFQGLVTISGAGGRLAHGLE